MTAVYCIIFHESRKLEREKLPRTLDNNDILLFNNRNVKDIINKIELCLLISSQDSTTRFNSMDNGMTSILVQAGYVSVISSTRPKSQNLCLRPNGQTLFVLMFIFDSSNDTVTCRKESFYIYLYGLKLYLPTQIPGFLSFLAEGTFEPQVFCYFSSDSQKKNLAIKINKIDNH